MVKSFRMFALGIFAAGLGACADGNPTGLPDRLSAGSGPNLLVVGAGVPGPGTAGSPVSYPLYAGGGGGGTGTLSVTSLSRARSSAVAPTPLP